jgi:sec-independent protein translocase protein TatC
LVKADVEMTFTEHLVELRRRIILALLGLAVSSVLCGIFWKELTITLVRPYKVAYDRMAAVIAADDAATKPPEGAKKGEPTAFPTGTDTALATAINRLETRLESIEKRLDVVSPTVGPDNKPVAYSGKLPPPRLIQGQPITGYMMIMYLCVICGIIVASPWILYQIWAFVGVGLHAHERKYIHIYGPFSFFMFILGGAMFYFLFLPRFLQFLMGVVTEVVVDGVPLIDPSFFLNDYFKFVAVMTLISGLVFELPLVVMFLARTGIIPLETLARQQRLVILIMIIVSALITPTVDPFSMMAMAVPMILLYELGLLLAWVSQRRARRREKLAEERERAGGGPPSD